MRSYRAASVLIVLGLIVAAPAPTQAASITYEFSGTVDNVTDHDDVWPESIQIGDRFQGRMTLDLAAPDLDPDPDLGEYDVRPHAALSISIGPVTLRNDPSELFVFYVRNDWRGPEDMVGFSVRNPVDSGFLRPHSPRDYYIWMHLLDDDAGEFDGDALPLDLDLSAFETARMVISNSPGGFCAISCFSYGFSVSNTIDAFEVVPEPGTLGLLGFGMVVLVIARRRIG